MRPFPPWRQRDVGHVDDPPHAQEASDELNSDLLQGVVLQASSFFEVETSCGSVFCTARSKAVSPLAQAGGIVPGDRVAITLTPDGRGVIEEVMPRKTQFSRKVAGKRRDEQVIAANLDQVVIVFAAANPPMKETAINRYLTTAEYCGLRSIVCINKADLVSIEVLGGKMSVYSDIGYDVIIASTVSGVGISTLRETLSGKMSALVGPSGVGKSSLISAVEPGLDLAVGDVSGSTGKGRHTTTSGRLIKLAGGGYVADTPGMREFGFYRIPRQELAWCFREFRPHIDACKFWDCTHTTEPGCRLREAVEQGLVSQARYEHYVRLMEEMR